MIWLLLSLSLLANESTINSDRYKTLPEWTHIHLNNFDLDQVETDLLRLLDRNVVYYKGDGKLYLHRQVIQVVQHPRAAREASGLAVAGNDEGSKLVGFKAWHLKPGGFSEKLSKRDLVIYGGGAIGDLSSQTYAFGRFSHVARGSVIVIETQEEIQSFLGTVRLFSVGGPFFTDQFIFESKDESDSETKVQIQTTTWGTAAWDLSVHQNENQITIHDVPEIPRENFLYRDPMSHPAIFFNAFVTGENRYESWHTYAKWYFEIYSKIALEPEQKIEPVALKLKQIEELTTTIRDRVNYRQVYLSHARGWEPLPGEEVIGKAYGDCKDMVSGLAYLCRKQNIPVLPVIANIVDGMYNAQEHPANPFFNHLISAIPIKQTLGLDSEVEVAGKRYLLIETTSKSTPLGKLPEDYRGREVLICTPQGAVWAAVPEAAISEDTMDLKVVGDMDGDHTFIGTILINCKGDPFGLRSQAMRYGQSTMDSIVQDLLEPPAAAVINLEDLQFNDNGLLTLKVKVNWPHFLYPDEDGYRLPQGLILDEWEDIAPLNRQRINPFKLRPYPLWQVQMKIKTPIAFTLDRDPKQGQAGPIQYTYHTEYLRDQSQLNIDYSFTAKSIIFHKNETRKARQFWRNFMADYNRFWRSETLFRKAT